MAEYFESELVGRTAGVTAAVIAGDCHCHIRGTRLHGQPPAAGSLFTLCGENIPSCETARKAAVALVLLGKRHFTFAHVLLVQSLYLSFDRCMCLY